MSEFPVQGRHGGGVAATRLGQKSGAIADAVVAEPADEFFSASRKGTLRKLDYAEIPGGKRSAQGKLLIQPAQGDTIAALLHLPTARGRRGGSPRRSGPAATAPDRPADTAPEPEEAEATQLTLGGWVEPEPAVEACVQAQARRSARASGQEPARRPRLQAGRGYQSAGQTGRQQKRSQAQAVSQIPACHQEQHSQKAASEWVRRTQVARLLCRNPPDCVRTIRRIVLR